MEINILVKFRLYCRFIEFCIKTCFREVWWCEQRPNKQSGKNHYWPEWGDVKLRHIFKIQLSSKSNRYGSTSDDWHMLIEERQANNGLEADKWPSLPFPLFHFAANTSDHRLVDKWLFLREWVPWPWAKGERSVSIHPQPVSGLLHSNLQKFPPAGNSLASIFSSSPL